MRPNNMNKRITNMLLIALCMAFIVLSGCSLGGQETKNTPTPEATSTPVGTDTPTPTPSDTPTPTSTSTPTPTPVVYLNNLGIGGMVFDDTIVNSQLHLVSVEYQFTYEGKLYSSIQLATNGKGNLAVLVNEEFEYAEGAEYQAEREYLLLITTIENGKVKIEKSIALGKAEYCWLTDKGNLIVVNKAVIGEDEKSHEYIQMFDYNGEETLNVALAGEKKNSSVHFADDPDFYYEADNNTHEIRKVSIVTGNKTNVGYSEKLLMNSIYGVSTINGVDYLCGSFMGVDLKKYECVLNAQTGEPFFIGDEDSIGYINSGEHQFTINGKYTEEGITSTIFDGKNLIKYNQNGSNNVSYTLLNGKAIASHTEYETHEETMIFEDGESYTYDVIDKSVTEIAIYDFDTASIITSNTFVNEKEKDLLQMLFIDENRLMVIFTDQPGALEIYIWDIDNRQYSEYAFDKAIDVEIVPFTGFDNPEITGQYVQSDFIPGECLESLYEEREYANQLEEKYGITILISNEARCIMSGYVFEALNSKTKLRECLEEMDKEFAKYPAGFFELYKALPQYPDGLVIYFTGGLVGFESNNLDRAGGLRTEDEDSINIALDGYDGRYEAAVHHEISHSVEVLIRELCSEKLDEDYWNSINVKYGGDRTYYAYSYNHQDSDWLYGYKDNYKYTLEYWMPLSRNWDYSSILFYDDYAMTYPTEDRSRIFECIMWDDMTFEKYPALNEKLVYYSSLIRKMLEENGITSDSPYYWEKAINVSEDEK